MAKKILMLRYGAYGDLLYILPVIDRIRMVGNIPYIHTGNRGIEIFLNDPRLAGATFFEPPRKDTEIRTNEELQKDVDSIMPDEFWNMSLTIETLVIPRRGDEMFEWTIEERRDYNKGKSFYDYPLSIGGFTRRPGECGRMAFMESEIAWAERWRETHKDQFVVLMGITGTTYQKRFPQSKEIGKWILDTFPDAVLYLCADPESLKEKAFSFGDGRTYAMTGASFRQTLLAARYSDYVIGPETGLMVGAGMWGTPKTMLCTTSSVFQCTDGHKNDFSPQAEIECSPCMRAIYELRDCYREPVNGMTECNYKFDLEKIKSGIELVHRTMRYRRDEDGALRSPFVRVPNVRADLDGLSSEPGCLRRGLPEEVREVRADGARQAD